MEEKVSPAANGAFMESLKRNNKQIREDRALEIAEDAEMTYKRQIEDMDRSIVKMERDRDQPRKGELQQAVRSEVRT